MINLKLSRLDAMKLRDLLREYNKGTLKQDKIFSVMAYETIGKLRREIAKQAGKKNGR